jgi:RNA recognition motif-containing protein
VDQNLFTPSSLLEASFTQPKVTLLSFLLCIESDIENYFNQYGTVVDVAIMKDKATGKSRGFAFVTFKDNSSENLKILS